MEAKGKNKLERSRKGYRIAHNLRSRENGSRTPARKPARTCSFSFPGVLPFSFLSLRPDALSILYALPLRLSTTRIFTLILALAAFVIAVPADISCGLEIGCGDVQSCIALSDAPPTTVIAQSGVIQVFNSNDKSLGYISEHLSGNEH